jgi:predicted AlkP superfamily phosphohydrolase/phosphomutase
MSDGQTNRLLILGLDGLSWPLLEPLLAAGVVRPGSPQVMPNLAQLRRESAWGPLTSVVPTQSAAAWATFLTGQNPARHGVVDFTVRQPDGRYRHAKPHPASTFWHHLARAGLRVGVFNFPVTYPPDPVPEGSFLVSGMLSPQGRTFTQPPALGAELLAAVPGYRLDVEWQLYAGRPEALLDDLTAMTRQRGRAAVYLREQYNPDCLAVAFIGPDRLLHALWADLDPAHPLHDADRAAALRPGIHAFFRALDEAVGDLVSAVGGAAVLVLSDHGFQAAAWQFRVDDWLAGQGWLTRQAGRSRLERWARRLDQPWVRRVRKRLVTDISRHLTTFAPGGTLDWARTLAFSPWNAQQGIRLNVRGREPQGIVEPGGAYEALRDEIQQALLAAVEPHSRQRVVDRVWRREEIYAGPYFESMPDLVFSLRPGFASSPMQPGLWDNTGWGTGDHSLEGLGLVRGPGVVPGRLDGAALVDVAPTALYLLGRPVPDEMDGQVWVGALDPAWLAARPVRRETVAGAVPVAPEIAGEALSPAEEAELQARLQGLGYL